jgi:dihydrofolate synthase/folylpolyglutamate synthase
MARSISVRTGARKKAPSTSIRTYQSALTFLDSVANYEKMTRVGYNASNFNLARMHRLLAAVDNPHKVLRSVHVAGTKGKGSTCMMLASMLANCGMKIGLYTSPHLIDLRERIQISGEMISEADFTRLVSRLAPIIKRQERDEPTFFEIMTALAFLHYVEKGVDLAVIETGLGGRLDSTNVLKPEVCAITSISYDHVKQLGRTLALIAEEKAGIFKPGVPAVSSPQAAEVREVLARVAEKVKAPLKFTGRDIEFSYRFESSRASGPQTRVSLITPNSRFEHLPVPLPGDHQAINCGLALSIMTVLKEKGFPIDDQKAIEGLAKAHMPGRMEVIHQDPRIMVDGAHNAASVEALMRAIGQNVSYDSMVVIFGCRSDKDIPGMLDHIQLGADKVIFTTTGSPRSADPAELSAQYVERSGKMAQVARSLQEALDIAERAVTREDLVCITGSFYLVGQAKQVVAERYAKQVQLRIA